MPGSEVFLGLGEPIWKYGYGRRGSHRWWQVALKRVYSGSAMCKSRTVAGQIPVEKVVLKNQDDAFWGLV